MLITLAAVLSACDTPSTSTSLTSTINTTSTAPPDTSVITLPTTPQTTPEPLVFPDSGFIKIGYDGYFKFQRVFDSIDEATYFEGVIFTPHDFGVTPSGPIAYSLDVRFADGTVEWLQNVGLGWESNIDIRVTKHENPKAGVILAWHEVNGGLRSVLYLLVSEN